MQMWEGNDWQISSEQIMEDELFETFWRIKVIFFNC